VPEYQLPQGIVDLGMLGGDSAYASAINNRLQIVGSTDTGLMGQTWAFVWLPEAKWGFPAKQVMTLGQVGNLPNCAAYDINDRGTIVGAAWNNGQPYVEHACVTITAPSVYSTHVFDHWLIDPPNPTATSIDRTQTFAMDRDYTFTAVYKLPANPEMIPDGSVFTGSGLAVVGAFGDSFYVEPTDRSWGIRVDKPGHTFAIGNMVSVVGPLGTDIDNDERFIAASSVTQTGSASVRPLAMPIKHLGGADWLYPQTGAGQKGVTGGCGLNNIGMLVRVAGKFGYIDPSTFTVDDGSGEPVKCVVPAGVTISQSWTNVGVTGICTCEKSGGVTKPVILLRRRIDIQTY